MRLIKGEYEFLIRDRNGKDILLVRNINNGCIYYNENIKENRDEIKKIIDLHCLFSNNFLNIRVIGSNMFLSFSFHGKTKTVRLIKSPSSKLVSYLMKQDTEIKNLKNHVNILNQKLNQLYQFMLNKDN